MNRVVPTAGLVAATLLLAGCATPRAGPMASELSATRVAAAGAEIVPLSSAVVGASEQPRQAVFPAPLLAGTAVDPGVLMPGDVVAISIFESGGGDTLMRSEGNARTDLEQIVVDPSGRIVVPYVGPLHVAGRSLEAVRAAIVAGLRRRTLDPQVVVRLGARQGMLVSVQGVVSKPGSYPLDARLTRLVDLLATAGVSEQDSEQVRVVVRRAGVSGAVRLADIFGEAGQNIALQPGDSVFVTKVNDVLTVLGAAGIQGRVPITSRRFSLIDALASARGANDDLADPRGVFLFRQDPGKRAAQIIQLDMRDPGELLLASQFQVRDGDAIYISNAAFAQTRKVLAVLASSFNAVRVAGAVTP